MSVHCCHCRVLALLAVSSRQAPGLPRNTSSYPRNPQGQVCFKLSAQLAWLWNTSVLSKDSSHLPHRGKANPDSRGSEGLLMLAERRRHSPLGSGDLPVSHSLLQAISAHPPSDLARERGMRRSWGLGGTLPVGEALWQEGICGHRVYLTSLLQPLTAWVGP